MRVGCGLVAVLVAGDTTCYKTDLKSVFLEPRVWKNEDVLPTVTQVRTVLHTGTMLMAPLPARPACRSQPRRAGRLGSLQAEESSSSYTDDSILF